MNRRAARALVTSRKPGEVRKGPLVRRTRVAGDSGRAVAAYTPLFYVPPRPLPGLLLIAPAALLLANVLAAWPGHRAARMRVAPVLRAE